MESGRHEKPEPVKPIPQRENPIVNPDGDDQKKRGLDDHLHRVPGKGDKLFEGSEMKKGQQKFTGKHPPQVRGDAEPGNAYEHKSQAQDEGGNIL